MDKKQRDALALAAMQGIISRSWPMMAHETVAREAYRVADAMLKESESSCPMCGAIAEAGKLIHQSGCEFGWPDAPLPGEN